jgi:hypothetical protein
MQKTPRRIIVLGMLRSGTSLTAELVRRWGAYAGPEDQLWKSEADDPRGYGYMEYIPLQEFNDELLEGNDRLPPPAEILTEKAADPTYQEKAQRLINGMDAETLKNQAAAWVWKDARLPLTLPFWVNFWEEVIYIITVRHPAETILSAAKTEGMVEENLPYSAGLAYWQYCLLTILAYTQPTSAKIFMAYDQLMAQPLLECTRLCHFLNQHCGNSPADFQAKLDAMLPQVSTSRRHYHHQKSLAEMEQTTREQRALYNFLRVKTLYPDEAFNPDDFALYPGWREYLQSIDLLLLLREEVMRHRP